MPKVDPATLREVQQTLNRYTDEVERSEMRITNKANYIIHARAFVRWLNDDFEPGKDLLRTRRKRT